MIGGILMKTVLITGASSGIGRAYVDGFAKRGYQLVLVSRRESLLHEIAEQIKGLYHTECLVIAQDLSEPDAARRIVELLDDNEWTIDVLVNCAGFATKGLLSHTDICKQHREFNVNIVALTELTHLIVGRMANRKKGMIINVASAAAYNPVPYNAVYSATKAYVLSFTQSIAYEYKDRGIYVLAVCPQATKTHFFDDFDSMGSHMREPEDVVRTTFLAIKEGKNVCSDGIFCSLQSMMSHLLSRKMCVRITGAVGKKYWGKERNE